MLLDDPGLPVLNDEARCLGEEEIPEQDVQGFSLMVCLIRVFSQARGLPGITEAVVQKRGHVNHMDAGCQTKGPVARTAIVSRDQQDEIGPQRLSIKACKPEAVTVP